MTHAAAPTLPGADLVGSGLARDQWLDKRSHSIGASEIAAILGLSPWESPYTIWARKRGVLDGVEENEAMRWGTVLEQEIAKEWSDRFGIATIQPDPITIYRSTALPIATASPDRLAVEGRGAKRKVVAWVEIKNVGSHKIDEWSEGIPDYYWTQAQWQLAVSGLDLTHVAALVGGQTLLWRRVTRDEQWISYAFAEAEKFWHLVESGVEPEVDGSNATKNAISGQYAEKTVDPVEGGYDLALAVAEYLDASAAEKDAKTAKTKAQNRIALILREHEVGTVENVPFVQIKTVHRGGYEVAPADYPRLTVLKGAKG